MKTAKEFVKEYQSLSPDDWMVKYEETICRILDEYAEGKVNELNKSDVIKSLSPHRCPVCGGNGFVPNRFYRQTSGQWIDTDVTPDRCRSCMGRGIVWG